MAKRLIEGKKKSKGKRYSHRPVRAENVYFDEVDRKQAPLQLFQPPRTSVGMLVGRADGLGVGTGVATAGFRRRRWPH